MAYVYKHIRKDTDSVFYIGIGKNIKRKDSKYCRNSHWHNIVKKTEFYSEIIEDNLTWEGACDREIFWIKYYGRKDLNEGPLVNMTNGGDGVVGRIVTESEKERIRNLRKGTKTSDETREKLRAKQYGRKYTDDAKKKMSESSIGKPKSEEHKLNIAKGGKEIKRTDEFKQNLSNLYKNRKRNPDMTWKKLEN
jgi:hypothetical protein